MLQLKMHMYAYVPWSHLRLAVLCSVVLIHMLQSLSGCIFAHKAQHFGQLQACMQGVGYGLGLASAHGGTIIQIIQIARILRSDSS